MLEVKVEQDPVVFHVVIFENSIWRRATNSVDELKTLVWENTNSCFKSTDSSSNIRRIIFGVRKKKLIKREREWFQIYENHICELRVKNWIWKRSS